MLDDLPEAVKHNDMMGRAEHSSGPEATGWPLFFDVSYFLLCSIIAFASVSIIGSKIATGESICILEKGNYVVNSDYPMFYYAGKLAASLGQLNVYDTVSQLNTINEAVSPVHFNTVPLLPYPPQLYLLMVLPALLPIHISFLVWVLGGALVSILAVYLLSRTNEHLSALERIAYSLTLLSIFPMYFLMASGQASAIWLVCLTLFFFGISRGWKLVTVLSIALMAMKPQFALILSAMSAAFGQWKQVIHAGGVIALSMLLPCFIWGFSVWSDYLAYVLIWSGNADGSIHPERQPSIRWLISMAPQPFQFGLVVFSFCICLALVTLMCWRARRDPELMRLAFTASIASTQFFFPYMHMYDWIIVWAAIGVSLRCFRPSRWKMLSGTEEKIFHAVVFAYPIIGVVAFLFLPDFGVRFNVPFVFANAILFVTSTLWFFKEQRALQSRKSLAAVALD